MCQGVAHSLFLIICGRKSKIMKNVLKTVLLLVFFAVDFALADALQSYVNEVKWNVTIFKSAVGAYALPAVPKAGS